MRALSGGRMPGWKSGRCACWARRSSVCFTGFRRRTRPCSARRSSTGGGCRSVRFHAPFEPPAGAANRAGVRAAIRRGLGGRGRAGDRRWRPAGAGSRHRLDALDAGGLRIVDYKTGRADRYSVGVPFAGGRRLQNVLYSLAVERLRPDESVRVMEYQFPTVKGENEVRAYPRAMLGREGTCSDSSGPGSKRPLPPDVPRWGLQVLRLRGGLSCCGRRLRQRDAAAGGIGGGDREAPAGVRPLMRLREEFGDGR